MYRHSLWNTPARTLLLIIAFGLIASTAQAEKWKRVTENTILKRGDKVQVEWHGQWRDGTIVDIDDDSNQFGNGNEKMIEKSDLPEFFKEMHKQMRKEMRKHRDIRVRFFPSDSAKEAITWPFSQEDLRIDAKNYRTEKQSSKQGNPFELGTDNPFEPDEGYREWKDHTGKFKIEAKLVEVKENAVCLKKRKDERVITVPLARLCEKDRLFIQQLQNKDKEEFSEESDDNGGFVDELPLKQAYLDSAETVYLSGDVRPSNLEPDGGATVKDLTKNPVVLPPSSNFSESIHGLYVASAAPNRIMLPYLRSHEYSQPTRFALCDLAQGGQKPRLFTFPVDVKAIAYSPSGDRVLSTPHRSGFGKKTRVDIWKIEQGKLRHELGWEPCGDGRHMGSDRDVEWAAFVDENHVLTCNGHEEVVLWSLPDVKAIYKIKIAFCTTPALSPGGKYLAAQTNQGLVVLDAMTGEVKGAYEKSTLQRGTIAFRPDGKRIALASTMRLMVWEFSEGTLYRDIGLNTSSSSSYYGSIPTALAWPAKNYVLLANRYLVDLEKYTLLWDYQGSEMAKSVNRYLYFLCGNNIQKMLIPQPLPHQEARDMAQQLQADNLKGIEPGADISLEVNIKGTNQEQDHIRNRFENQLENRGFKIVPNAPIKLVVATKQGEMEKVLYSQRSGRGPFNLRPFSSGQGDFDIVMFRQQISEVAFVIDGETAWVAYRIASAPSGFQLEQGESIQQAVKKREKPNLKFFDLLEIPSHIARPNKNMTYGASRLTPSGLQSAKPLPKKVEKKSPVQQTSDPVAMHDSPRISSRHAA